jgi:hypothetical protein
LQSAAAEEADGVEGRAVQGQSQSQSHGGNKKGGDGKKEKGKGKYRIPVTQRGNEGPSEVWNPFSHLKDI